MNILLAQRAIESFAAAPLPVQKAFIKQLSYLVRNIQHPSLHAKKFDESRGRWQARVTGDWRFYFHVEGDTYRVTDLIPHPK